MKTKKICWAVCFSAALLMFAGCGTPAYNVEVFMSPKVKEKYQIRPSVEVDIVGMNESTSEHFSDIAVDDYFTPGNMLRYGQTHATLQFSEENGAPKRILKSDVIWTKFAESNSNKLYLLVNLPNSSGGKKTKNDLRKIMLPLESSWFEQTYYIEITPSGLLQLKERPSYPTEKIQIQRTENIQ